MLAAMDDYDAADRIGWAALKLSNQAEGSTRAEVLVEVVSFGSHWRHYFTKNLEMAGRVMRQLAQHAHAVRIAV